ncbi:MAG: NAD(+)/NADH kinase [Oscillospiraceae bacterium]|nr:NAD(+)/NADH kinase [Oscillospiraceae bacterium]
MSKNLKVFIVSKTEKVDKAVLDKLSALGIERADCLGDCDIVITIGGDGTILRAGKESAKVNKPLLGINTGHLGFMATLERDGLDKLARLVRGEYTTSRRMLLDVQIGDIAYRALNDVVLHRGAASRLPDFTVICEETEVIRIRADGIIVSTPTGSTAYSLSAGGPIIEPRLECFLVTALCPHTLFNRPMIFSPEGQLQICTSNVSVSIDGEESALLNKECGVITITKSKEYLELIDIDGNSFYDSVHNKLMKPLK